MKNNLNQHIDTKLKSSFDAIQKKAPEHLWDQISEKMTIEDTIDSSMDEKIQTAHLAAPLKKAPASIWDKIDDALEETTPIDTIIDKKVKDGFLSKTKVAPVFLWGAISEELNAPPVSVDTALDDKLREGFLTQETKKTPNKVWYAVSRQLNIDKTWDRISKVLDKEPVVSDWSGRILRFLGVAALCLLLLKTCTKEPYTIPSFDLAQEVGHSNKEVNKAPVATLGTNTVAGLEKEANQKQNNSPLNPLNSKNSELLKTNNKNLIGTLPTLAPKHSSKRGKVEHTTGSSSIVVPKVAANAVINSKKAPAIITAGIPTELKGTSTTSIVEGPNEINKKSTAENIERITSENKNSPQGKEKESLNIALLDALALNPLANHFTIEPIQLLDEIELEKKKKLKKNLIEGKLEAGAFVVVNSTMLLNNETREGFDQNSLITNYFGLAANYGLWASYKIIPRGALVAEFSINADNRQAYGTYEKGVFYIKEWVMKYNRFSLAYKHDLWQTSSDKLVNTKVVAQAGVYVGMLREAKLFYDGVLFFDKQSDYHQFDFGFKVALGQEILIDKFVLGYGIRSDIGASNIFKGNNQLNAGEDQTNIIHIGGYVLLGYRF